MASQGLVGFFDILGYQNIIDNNTIDDVSGIISRVLLKLPECVMEEMSRPFKDDHEQFVFLKKSISGLESRLISDSILLVFPVDPALDARGKLISFLLFTNYVAELLNLTFSQGLPTRGAVDFGEYFLEGHCFAGKPIINCYRLGNSLDFAGCVMTTRCRDEVVSLLAADGQINIGLNSFGYDYLCPCKGNSYERLLMVRWFRNIAKTTDLRQSVFEAFKAHNKDIGPGVESKITNTEFTLRFLKQKTAESKLPSRKRKKNE